MAALNSHVKEEGLLQVLQESFNQLQVLQTPQGIFIGIFIWDLLYACWISKIFYKLFKFYLLHYETDGN